MNMKMCATSDVAKEWDKIDWNKANAYVKKLQMRIVKAHQEGKHGRVKFPPLMIEDHGIGGILPIIYPIGGPLHPRLQLLGGDDIAFRSHFGCKICQSRPCHNGSAENDHQQRGKEGRAHLSHDMMPP